MKAFVAANHPEVNIVKASGGSGAKFPRYKFKNVRLVSASELAEKHTVLEAWTVPKNCAEYKAGSIFKVTNIWYRIH